MSAGIEAAEQVVAALKVAGVRAYVDPGKAENNRPCVLVAPPTQDYTRGTAAGPEYSWRHALLSSKAAGSLECWRELDELLDLVADVLNVERIEPRAYRLSDTAVVPAYIATVTT